MNTCLVNWCSLCRVQCLGCILKTIGEYPESAANKQFTRTWSVLRADGCSAGKGGYVTLSQGASAVTALAGSLLGDNAWVPESNRG